MEKKFNDVALHMRGLGLGALKHAIWHANYYSPENEWWNELSVLQAAHAAEILIKARIAEEHPLLIFETFPKVRPDNQEIKLDHLIQSGRTVLYSDLPDRLWATTGIRLSDVNLFKQFGTLRNTIQHFAVPERADAGGKALEFIFGVLDPFINECWGEFAIDHNEDHEPYTYLVDGLILRKIKFLVSPECAKEIDLKNLEISKRGNAYVKEMEKRFSKARVPAK